jgi:hypothetical protein
MNCQCKILSGDKYFFIVTIALILLLSQNKIVSVQPKVSAGKRSAADSNLTVGWAIITHFLFYNIGVPRFCHENNNI